MSWDVRYFNGVYLPQLDWWLDARQPVARGFVSHAHFDHLAPHREVLLTPGTAALMRARLPDPGGGRLERELDFGKMEPLSADHPQVGVMLHPAGHIHGSAMIALDHPEFGRLLYTGDFKLRPGRSCERCDPPRADTLIMETTYGRPHYVFPPTGEVLAAVAAWCRAAVEEGEVPVLFGYSLGKSQEILSCLDGAGLPVMLHPQTLKLTQIYEALGQVFPPYAAFDSKRCDGHVVICPPQTAHSGFVRRIPRKRTAVLTGWALDPGARFRYQCDEVFPLSDHADYPDLLRLVELTGARRVLTLHGFAADFARDLRERGVEAWAINQTNQLEFALPVARPAGIVAAGIELRAVSVSESAVESEGGLAKFASVAERIRDCAAKSAKVVELAGYLALLAARDLEDAARAALFFTARPFPQSEGRALGVGWALLRRAVLEVAGANEGDFRTLYRKFGDGGETAGALIAAAFAARSGGRRGGAGGVGRQPFALAALEALFARLAAEDSPMVKLGLLADALRGMSPAEAKYLIKIVSGDLRIGLRDGLVEEAVAMASGRPLAEVREAHLLCGDLAAVTRAAFERRLSDMTLRVFHPLQFMLASPEPSAEAVLARLGAPLWVEEKYDGIRAQLHKRGDRVELFSRDLRRITDSFPDLVACARRELKGDCVLDGELLAWRNGQALPFSELQKRLNRRALEDDFFAGERIPVAFLAFDLLWLNGEPLIRSPLAERRRRLEAFLDGPGAEVVRGILASPVMFVRSVSEVDAAFSRAIRRGNEGLMAKDPASAYSPGRRGHAWVKLKKARATLEVVVVAVEEGHGKRKGVLSDYTFAVRDEAGALRVVGKAYSGLTDAEIAALTEHFRANTLEEHGRVRRVVPDTVLEVAFDRIRPSTRYDGGFALRFPRIVRLRPDKTPAEIDTLESCRKLAASEGVVEDGGAD